MRILSPSDRDLWRSFRRVAEVVNISVERDLMTGTNLSGPDHGILSRLAGTEAEPVRQQELAGAMRWDRTRLSHHLTRMEARGLIKRSRLGGGRGVQITERGDRARRAADPIHAKAVMKYFVSKLTPEQRESISSIAKSLSADQ